MLSNHTITNSESSTNLQNFLNILEFLPTPETLIKEMYSTEEANISTSHSQSTSTFKEMSSSHEVSSSNRAERIIDENQIGFDSYISNSLNNDAINIEMKAATLPNDKNINWDYLIENCISSLNIRDNIDITSAGIWGKEIHETLLLRTATLLLNLYFASYAIHKNDSKLEIENFLPIQIINKLKPILFNRKSENSRDGESTILILYTESVLKILHLISKENANAQNDLSLMIDDVASNNTSNTNTIDKKSLLAEVNYYTDYFLKYCYAAPGDPLRALLVKVIYEALPARIYFNNSRVLTHNLEILFYEIASTTNSWLELNLEYLIKIFLQINFTELNQNAKDYWEEAANSALSATINYTVLKNYQKELIKRFKENLGKKPRIDKEVEQRKGIETEDLEDSDSNSPLSSGSASSSGRKKVRMSHNDFAPNSPDQQDTQMLNEEEKNSNNFLSTSPSKINLLTRFNTEQETSFTLPLDPELINHTPNSLSNNINFSVSDNLDTKMLQEQEYKPLTPSKLKQNGTNITNFGIKKSANRSLLFNTQRDKENFNLDTNVKEDKKQNNTIINAGLKRKHK